MRVALIGSPDQSTEIRSAGGNEMKITAVTCFRVSGEAELPASEARQVGMLDSYPEFARREPQSTSSPREITACYVEIETDNGPTGLFGPIFEETAALIRI